MHYFRVSYMALLLAGITTLPFTVGCEYDNNDDHHYNRDRYDYRYDRDYDRRHDDRISHPRHDRDYDHDRDRRDRDRD